jgi:hypothetical protein
MAGYSMERTGTHLAPLLFAMLDCFPIWVLRPLRLSDTPVLRRAFPRTAQETASFGVVENQNLYDANGAHEAVLHAYDARDLSHELYNSNQAPNGRDYFGANNKFITPMIANSKILCGSH